MLCDDGKGGRLGVPRLGEVSVVIGCVWPRDAVLRCTAVAVRVELGM
jgi:hypothetical protein